jgi:hypothetical protein
MVTNTSSKELRKMSDEALADYMAGWKQDTGNYILSEMEFKRRQSAPNELRGWISVILAVLAIITSVVALVTKSHVAFSVPAVSAPAALRTLNSALGPHES